VLDAAELIPVRAKAPSIVIDSDAHELSSTAAKHYRGGGTSKLSLQLPSPHTHIVRKAGAASGGGSAAAAGAGGGGGAQQHGDAAWQELLKSQQQQGKQGKQQGGQVSKKCGGTLSERGSRGSRAGSRLAK
jgi:hypothetical protein